MSITPFSVENPLRWSLQPMAQASVLQAVTTCSSYYLIGQRAVGVPAVSIETTEHTESAERTEDGYTLGAVFS